MRSRTGSSGSPSTVCSSFSRSRQTQASGSSLTCFVTSKAPWKASFKRWRGAATATHSTPKRSSVTSLTVASWRLKALRWTLTGDADTVEVPSTVEGVLQARLDRLSSQAREVLHRAAVVGRTFWRGSLIALGCDDRHLDHHLDELQRREFVFKRGESVIHGDTEYIFKQTLVRDVAYANLLRSRRMHHHQAVAQWLAKHRHGRGDDFMLGHHFERGDRPESAVLAYLGAANAALDSNALEEALAVHSRALTIAERHPEVEVTPPWSATSLPADSVVLLSRARAHFEHDDFDAALEDLERVERSLQRSGRVAGLARCLALRGEVLLAAGGDGVRSEEVGDLAICARDLARCG